MLSMDFCIKCGFNKPQYSEKCTSCRFLPKTRTDVAKSMLLSKKYNWEQAGLPYGPKQIELKVEQIKAGNLDVFELEHIKQAANFWQSHGRVMTKLYAVGSLIGFTFLVGIAALFITGVL